MNAIRKVITYLIIAAAVLMAVIAFVVLRDDIDSDTMGIFRSWFSGGGESGEAGEIPFDESRGAVLALCDGRLVSLSSDRLVLYDKAGREKVSRAVSFELPALAVAGSKVVAYDRRAGNTAVVADTGGIRAEIGGAELTAAGNARGQYILVTSESGYRGVARLYDGKNKNTYNWYSAERYIYAVSLSPSGRRMAVAAVSQRGDGISTRVTFLEPGRAEPLGTADIEDELPLAAYSPDNNHVCIITESGVYFYTDDGLPLEHYSYGGLRLLSAHPAEEALFLNLGRNEGGQYSRLICLSYTGAELGQVQFTEGPDGLAAAGRYCAVLEAGILTRYTVEGGALKAEEPEASGARGLLIAQNGDILLLYSSYARWYNE